MVMGPVATCCLACVDHMTSTWSIKSHATYIQAYQALMFSHLYTHALHLRGTWSFNVLIKISDI